MTSHPIRRSSYKWIVIAFILLVVIAGSATVGNMFVHQFQTPSLCEKNIRTKQDNTWCYNKMLDLALKLDAKDSGLERAQNLNTLETFYTHWQQEYQAIAPYCACSAHHELISAYTILGQAGEEQRTASIKLNETRQRVSAAFTKLVSHF